MRTSGVGPTATVSTRTWRTLHSAPMSATVATEPSSLPSVTSSTTPPAGRSRTAVAMASSSSVWLPAGVTLATAAATAPGLPATGTVQLGASLNSIRADRSLGRKAAQRLADLRRDGGELRRLDRTAAVEQHDHRDLGDRRHCDTTDDSEQEDETDQRLHGQLPR